MCTAHNTRTVFSELYSEILRRHLCAVGGRGDSKLSPEARAGSGFFMSGLLFGSDQLATERKNPEDVWTSTCHTGNDARCVSDSQDMWRSLERELLDVLTLV